MYSKNELIFFTVLIIHSDELYRCFFGTQMSNLTKRLARVVYDFKVCDFRTCIVSLLRETR